MPQMGDNKVRARMMEMASRLFHDTQLEDLSKPQAVEQIARDAIELAGLAKVFLVRAHDQRLAPYSSDQQQAIVDKLRDNLNVTGHENLWDNLVCQAVERRNRA